MAGQAVPFLVEFPFRYQVHLQRMQNSPVVLMLIWCQSSSPHGESCAGVKNKRKRSSDIFEAYTVIYRAIMPVFVLLRINCAPCLSRMHDNQRRPRGKVLMISLPSLHEKWLYCLSAQHSICYENDVRRVLDTAGLSGAEGVVGRPITPRNQTKKVSGRARLHRALAPSRAPLWPRAFNILFYANRVS